MRSNDLLIFDFHSDAGREVFIDPALPQEIAEFLRRFFEVSSKNYLLSEEPPNIQIMLAAIDKGSIKVAFKYIVDRLHKAGQTADDIDKILNLADRLTKIFLRVSISLGFLHVASVEEFKLLAADEEVSEKLSSDSEVHSMIESLTTRCLSFGADHVFIYAPEYPTCEFTLDGQSSPRHLGSMAPIFPVTLGGPVSGELTILDRSLEVSVGGSTKRMPVARFMVNKSENNQSPTWHFDVLVDWKSKRPVPKASEMVVVGSGTIRPLREVGITANEKIHPNDRHISAVLSVDTVMVFE